MQHLVGTYNMSFYSDKGFDPTNMNKDAQSILATVASERAFHMSNTTGNWRQFWINALGVVQRFWNEPDASVLSLQEMTNTSYPNTGAKDGTTVVQEMLYRQNPALRMVVGEVKDTGPGKNSNVSTCILWDSVKLGDLAGANMADPLAYYVETRPMMMGGVSSRLNPYLTDLDYDVPAEFKKEGSNKIKLTAQNGRPMLMLLTTKGYLLVSIHAPNHAPLAERNLDELRTTIKTTIATFLQRNGKMGQVDPTKIFIMGDFNDRYDALQSLYINVGGTPDVVMRYNGTAPLSCCHNWDSSCTNGRFIRKPNLQNRVGRQDIGTCNIVKPDGTEYALVGMNPRDKMGEEGNIEQYRYYGDKVFGYNPVGKLSLFPPGRTGPSSESDHEMVVGRFLEQSVATTTAAYFPPGQVQRSPRPPDWWRFPQQQQQQQQQQPARGGRRHRRRTHRQRRSTHRRSTHRRGKSRRT